jgi:hypothetical protein
MGTIKEKLDYLQETKELFREVMSSMGAYITDETTFRQYVELLRNANIVWKNDIQLEDIIPYMHLKNININNKINDKIDVNLISSIIDCDIHSYNELIPYLKVLLNKSDNEISSIAENCYLPYTPVGGYIDSTHLTVSFPNPIELLEGKFDNWNINGYVNGVLTQVTVTGLAVEGNVLTIENENLDSYGSALTVAYIGNNDLIRGLDKVAFEGFSVTVDKI